MALQPEGEVKTALICELLFLVRKLLTALICESKVFEPKIVWRNVVGMAFLHIGAIYWLYAVTTSEKFRTLPLFYMLWVNIFASFGILAGAHRLWTHRSYKAKLPLRLFLAIFQTTAMQNDIYEWCR